MEKIKTPIKITRKDFIDVYDVEGGAPQIDYLLPVSTCHMCFSGWGPQYPPHKRSDSAAICVKTITYALTPANPFCTRFIEEKLYDSAIKQCTTKERAVAEEMQKD